MTRGDNTGDEGDTVAVVDVDVDVRAGGIGGSFTDARDDKTGDLIVDDDVVDDSMVFVAIGCSTGCSSLFVDDVRGDNTGDVGDAVVVDVGLRAGGIGGGLMAVRAGKTGDLIADDDDSTAAC